MAPTLNPENMESSVYPSTIFIKFAPPIIGKIYKFIQEFFILSLLKAIRKKCTKYT